MVDLGIEAEGQVPSPANAIHMTVDVLGVMAVEKEKEMVVRVRRAFLFADGEIVHIAATRLIVGRVLKPAHEVADVGEAEIALVILREKKIEANEEVARAGELRIEKDIVDSVDDVIEADVSVGDDLRAHGWGLRNKGER